MDARRDEVYSAVFDSNFNMVRKVIPEIIKKNSFDEYISENKLFFIGNGQEKCERLIKKNSNLIFSSNNTFPSAKEMTFLSYQKFNSSDFEDIAYFEPDYLKEFISG